MASNNVDPPSDDDRPKPSFSAFAALQVEDAGGAEPEEEEDFGGLMVRLLYWC